MTVDGAADGPVRVTGSSRDPEFGTVIVDGDEQRSGPVQHRRVHARFEGTDARFDVYLPGEGWEHRFHHCVYPLADEQAEDRSVASAAASGAYLVQSNSPGGYRIDAAAAKASKVIAAEHYGSTSPIHGYLYGASGGGYQTIGAMENTTGVWDGAVPMVIGLPTSIPNNFFVRALARFVLQDKAEAIADAVRPGGGGDAFAGLDEVEAVVLREVTRMGVPLRAFEDHLYVFGREDPDQLLGFAPVVRELDPSYAEDFWTLDGYLGTEPSALGDRFRQARNGDNDWELALLSYHRHQIPSRGGFVAFDQFRAPDGAPIHPQRPIEIGPLISGQVCGTGSFPSHTGEVSGKMILLQNLLDPDGWPSHGAWYHQEVRRSLGATTQDTFRLWFNDHADHFAGPESVGKEHRIVDYAGILGQALRDVAAWAERGEAPAVSTAYEEIDGQIHVPDDAGRGGIQPVVDLTVGGRRRVEVAVGEPVRLRAEATVPLGAGRVVAAEWSHLGSTDYSPALLEQPSERLVLETDVTFVAPGTYFPVIRVTAGRAGSGDPGVMSLGRMRVVVA